MRWDALAHSIDLNEALIVKQYEEVMIKNQLLNVTFDDMTSEKNKKKLLLQTLRS